MRPEIDMHALVAVAKKPVAYTFFQPSFPQKLKLST
jgi:hypothetical protein